MFGVSVCNSGPQRVVCVKGTSQHISCVNRSAMVLEAVMKIIFYSRCYIIPNKRAEIDRSNERSPGEVGGLCACGGQVSLAQLLNVYHCTTGNKTPYMGQKARIKRQCFNRKTTQEFIKKKSKNFTLGGWRIVSFVTVTVFFECFYVDMGIIRKLIVPKRLLEQFLKLWYLVHSFRKHKEMSSRILVVDNLSHHSLTLFTKKEKKLKS